jgi:uncharacterized cupredoxin-like copper-binding protein
MRRRAGSIAAIACALLSWATIVAPIGDARPVAPTHDLRIDLAEWAVVPSDGVVSSGVLRLKVANHGRLFHELDIVPTRTWGESLRVRYGRAVGDAVARPIVVRPGHARSALVVLQPGYYVLLDNIPGHYAAGAAVSIVVL